MLIRLQGKDIEVWFSKDAMTNVLSMGLLEKDYRITHDSKSESTIVIHLPHCKLKFTKGPEGIYYYEAIPRKSQEEAQVHCPQTVEDNTQFYSDHQVSRAKRAWSLLHATGCLTVSDLRKILKMNSIADCPVTAEDIDLAEKIYGPDMASLKGKTICKKPQPIVHDYVSIPKELVETQQDLTLSIDAIFVNSMPFLTTISENLKFRTADFLSARTIEEYHKTLDKVFGVYNDAEFGIKRIKCNQEFQPILDPVKRTLHIKVNYASAQEHIPKIE